MRPFAVARDSSGPQATVAGAAALVAANNPTFDAAGIKAAILDNAETDIFLGNTIQGQRLLRIDTAVGP